MKDDLMLDLADHQPIFIGFKMTSSLSRELEAVSGPDTKYVSTTDSTFLRICLLGDKRYVGKLIHERLTTDRVDDVRRNIFSILNRLCPETRLPQQIEILACSSEQEPKKPSEPGPERW